jgi:hypothetical protein
MSDNDEDVDDVNLAGQSWSAGSNDATAAAEPLWPSMAAKSRTLLALIVMVIICDLTLYRCEGFAGVAVFLIVAPVVLLCARSRSVVGPATVVCGVFLVCLAGRLAWCGSPLALFSGFGVFAAFAVSLNGRKPFVLRTLAQCGLAVPYGAEVLGQLASGTRSVVTQEPSVQRAGTLSIIIPILAVSALV